MKKLEIMYYSNVFYFRLKFVTISGKYKFVTYSGKYNIKHENASAPIFLKPLNKKSSTLTHMSKARTRWGMTCPTKKVAFYINIY